MALCPLLKAECKRDKCQWWYSTNEKYIDCSVVLLIEQISQITDDIKYKDGTLQSLILDPDNPKNEPVKKALKDIFEKYTKEEKQQ